MWLDLLLLCAHSRFVPTIYIAAAVVYYSNKYKPAPGRVNRRASHIRLKGSAAAPLSCSHLMMNNDVRDKARILNDHQATSTATSDS